MREHRGLELLGNKRGRRLTPLLVLLLLSAAPLGAAGCRLDRLLEELAHPEGAETPPPPPAPTEDRADRGPQPKPRRNGRTPRADSPEIHLAMGVPEKVAKGRKNEDPDDDLLLKKPQYALSYNRSRNGANWVSWELNDSWFGSAPRHKGKFLVDDSLPEGFYRVKHDDYSGSGFDRGHMVRSEERTRSVEDNKATFVMTNILPQTHDLNAGPWLRFEEECQDLAQKEKKELFLVAGGIFGRNPETIGNGVAVPTAFFKIAVVLEPGESADDVTAGTRVIAVIMPNKTGIQDEGWGRYRTSVDEVERRTGYDFLTALPSDVAAVVEARVDDGPTDEARR